MCNRSPHKPSLPVAPGQYLRSKTRSGKPFPLISFAVPQSLNSVLSHRCKNSGGRGCIPLPVVLRQLAFLCVPLNSLRANSNHCHSYEKTPGVGYPRRFPIRESCSRPAVSLAPRLAFQAGGGGCLSAKDDPLTMGTRWRLPSRFLRIHAAVGMHTQEFIRGSRNSFGKEL